VNQAETSHGAPTGEPWASHPETPRNLRVGVTTSESAKCDGGSRPSGRQKGRGERTIETTLERKMATVTRVDFEPLTVAVPLWEDPPGVFRVGNSRVLLELVLSAFKRGETPESIVRSYRTLNLADVYALISRYLANPVRFDEYLRECEEKADSVRREIEAAQGPGISKDDLMARGRAQGVIR
jgi:uncharacterized protein (DUF433 family)